MKLDNKGPILAEILDIDLKYSDVQIEFRDSYDNILMLYGDLELEVDPKDYYRGHGYVTELRLSGSDKTVPDWIVELANKYIEELDVSEQLMELEADKIDHAYESMRDEMLTEGE